MAFPDRLPELLQAHPDILSNVIVVRYSASFSNIKSEVISIKKQVLATNATYYNDTRYQIECYLIATYQADKNIKVVIHESKPLRKMTV